jgi:hypothetical protein
MRYGSVRLDRRGDRPIRLSERSEKLTLLNIISIYFQTNFLLICRNICVFIYVGSKLLPGFSDILDFKNIKSCPATCHEGTWGERRYSSYSYLTSALDGGE